MSTKIATLNVRLTATAGAFAATMSAASRRVTSLGRQVTSLGSKVFSFGGALTALAAGGGMAYLVKQSMESIDATAKLSDRLGIATEALIGLQHHADLSGVSAEALTGGLEKMFKTLGDGATKGGAAAAAFAKLGLSAEGLANMPTDQAFAEIAQALSDIENPAERAHAAMEIFGRSGQQLLPMMLAGKEGIAAAQAEAEKLGLTFSRTDAAKVEAANDALTRMQKLFTGAAQTLAIQLSPFIDAAAAKLTAMGSSGEGMGSKIVTAFEWVLKAIAYGANVVDGFRIGLKSLQLAFSWAFGKGIEAGTQFAEAIAWVVNKAVEGVNYVIRQMNKLPKVNIPEIEMRLEVDRTMADAIIADQQALREELANDISRLAEFDNAAKVSSFFDDIRSTAQANGDAIADNAKKLNSAAFNAEDFAEKLKQAEDNAKKVGDTLADLQKDVTRFGLSDNQNKLLDLKALGATPEQMAKARQLLALKDELGKLDSIDTGDSVTDFAAKMEQLQKLYASGKVTAEQFAAIRDTAKQTLNDKLTEQARSITESVKSPLEKYAEEIDKLNLLLERGLLSQEVYDKAVLAAKQNLSSSRDASAPLSSAIRAGSAEAMKIAFDNARGVQRLSKEQLTEKQYAEAKKSSSLLDRIERNTRGAAVEIEEVSL